MNELVKAVLAGIDADSGDETAREEATEALLLLVALVAELEQGAGEKESRLARYANLLQRIFHWDHMDTAVITFSDLTSRSEEDLLALEQFGPACLGDAKKELSYYGLKLAVPLPRAEVARLRLANHQESDYPHRCFTDEGDWVSCPPELCEADFLLREALARTEEIARLAGLLRTECGSDSRFREVYGGSENE